jgi:hypothetical protein
MTDRIRSLPYTLSLSLNDQTFFGVDLLFLIFVALGITCSIFISFGFGDIFKCPLSKPFGGFAAPDDDSEFPQSLDYNYKPRNRVKDGINKYDGNAGRDSAQRTPLSSNTSSGIPGGPSILCTACQDGFKAQSLSLSETTSTSGSGNSRESVEIVNPDNSPASLANAALTSLADDLETLIRIDSG